MLDTVCHQSIVRAEPLKRSQHSVAPVTLTSRWAHRRWRASDVSDADRQALPAVVGHASWCQPLSTSENQALLDTWYIALLALLKCTYPLPRCHELGFSASHHPKEGANGEKKRAKCILHIKARHHPGWYMRLRGVFRPVRDACVAGLVVLAGARFALSSSLTPLAPLA